MALNTYHHYINKDYFHNILYVVSSVKIPVDSEYAVMRGDSLNAS